MKIKKICQQCGKEYLKIPAQAERSRFCSRACNGRYRALRIPHDKRMGNKKPALIKSCVICGTLFKTGRHHGGRKTCSDKCNRHLHSQNTKQRDSRIELICKNCSTPFRVFPSRKNRLYCSKACTIADQSNHQTGKRRFPTSVLTECGFCGKQIKKFKSRLTYKKHFCSNECRMQSDVFSSPSSIEDTLAEWLAMNGIAFDRQVPVWRFTVDFKVGDCFLEVNGDYWHALPGKYALLNPQQRRRVHRDKLLNTYCKNRGIELLTIWEHEIKANNFSKLESLKHPAPA